MNMLYLLCEKQSKAKVYKSKSQTSH